MRIRRVRTYRLYRQTKTRALNITTALVMVGSSLSGIAPLLFSHGASAATQSVTQLSTNWTSAEPAATTVSGGSATFINDSSSPNGVGALHLATDSTVASKVQYMDYFSTPVALSAVASGSMSFHTKQNSASFAQGDPSYQVPVYLNGTSGFDTFVFEPYVGQASQPVQQGTWQNWDVSNGLFYSTHSAIGSGGSVVASQGSSTYTLAQLLIDFPSANILGIGLNVGANNPSYDTEVSDISFNGTTYNFEPAAAPNDVYVDTTYSSASGGGHTFGYDAFTTIQDGVDAVATNGTVHVDAGSYAPTTINKTIALKGAQTGVSALGRTHGAASESLIVGLTTYSPSFNVTANNVTVDGFDFGPATDGATSGPIGINLGSTSGAIVKDSIFEHNQRGISLAGAGSVTISDDLISNNNADPENNAGIWGDGVHGITISNSELDGASNTAINLATSQDITINATIFKDDGNTAVIWQDSNTTFSNNYGRGFNGSGLFITGSSNVTVTNNDMSLGTTFNGISISTASGTASSGVTITGNTFSGFANAINLGAASAISDTLVVHGNKLGDNSSAGINGPSNASTLVNASGNWWGDASGPNDPTSGDGSTPATNAGTGTAANGAVNYSQWCINASCAAPALLAPTLISPANGAYTNDPAFNDTWTPVDGAAKYEYRTSNTESGGNMGSIIYSDNSTSSNYTITPSLITRGNNGTPQGVYYWQVRAIDADGNAGPWSVIFKVTVDTATPSLPTLLTPLNSSFKATNDFYFTWTDSSDSSPVTYEFQSAASSSLDSNGSLVNAWDSITNGDSEQNNLVNPQIHSTGAPDGTYYWQVRAIDAAGNKSAWTSPWKMTIDTAAPTGLANVSPNDGTVTTTAKQQLITWTAANDANSHISYYYESSNSSSTNGDGSFVSPVYQSGALSDHQIPTGGTPAGTYYWHVRAVDAAGNSTAWTAAWKIVVDNSAPDVPTLQFPSNGVHRHTSDSNYSQWSTVTDPNGPVTYYYESAFDTAFTNIAYGPQALTTHSIANPNEPEGTYYWRVKACDAAGNCSDWSQPWTINIDNTAPTTPVADPGAGTYTTGQLVSLSSTDADGTPTIYYTTDGSTPSNTNGTLYIGAFTVAASETVQAIAYDQAGNTSPLLLSAYTITPVPSTPINTTNTNTNVVTFTNLVQQVATTGPATTTGNTTGGNSTTGSAGNTNGTVLGTSTTNGSGSTGQVKGDSTVNLKTVGAKKNGSFLTLGWWWLAIIAAIAGVWLVLGKSRKHN